MNKNMSSEIFHSESIVDQLLSEYDETSMPIPDIELEPHLLISKVRKHYMDYMIKLLSVNYENNQRLLNKNIYLPSAIWRCAKNIETKAAQMCMVVQLYRKNIISVVKELKRDTKNGKLNKNLYECLHRPPENEKNVQTSYNLHNCDCPCKCKSEKRRRKMPGPPHSFQEDNQANELSMPRRNVYDCNEQRKIPVLINSHLEYSKSDNEFTATEQPPKQQVVKNNANLPNNNYSPKLSVRMSVESQDSDELMMQLEKLFQGDPNDEDLFDGALCDTVESAKCDEIVKKFQPENSESCDVNSFVQNHDVFENHAAQIKSLDERLATLAGLLVNNPDSVTTAQQKQSELPKSKRCISSNKWLCEEYFLKTRLLELLDQIGDCNRKKLARIKEMLLDLFGDDSDDEGVVSPLDETPEFIISCKERIAPWVVKLLTPYYIKGRIRGKALFKALAKHLIRLIYQCSRYPNEYEVQSFVADFLENHKMIRCEADFKQFKIENI